MGQTPSHKDKVMR